MNYILNWDPPIDKTDHYFLAILKSNDEQVQELTDWEAESGMSIKWKDLEKGFNLLTWENNQEILRKIKAYISKIS